MSFLPSHWGMNLNMEHTAKLHLNQRGMDNMIIGTSFLDKHANGPWFCVDL